MKGILNVLYRRILYKIPLKLLLILLAVFAVLFASFSDAGLIFNYEEFTINAHDEQYESDGPLILRNINCSTISYTCEPAGPTQKVLTLNQGNDGICLSGLLIFTSNQICTWGVGEYEAEPSTQVECEENYTLIPISNIDSNYCETNNLCPSGGVSSGDVSWSALYINNIQHLGGPNIYITIPEEIWRDYNYNDYDDMYINVSGYNVDYDKITGIIDTQNYKPTTEDFNYIVSSVIPLFVPGLVIILFLYWIFRFIKKIF